MREIQENTFGTIDNVVGRELFSLPRFNYAKKCNLTELYRMELKYDFGSLGSLPQFRWVWALAGLSGVG